MRRRIVVAREHRDGQGAGLGEPGGLGALFETGHPGLQHRHPSPRVHGEVGDTEGAGDARRPVHRVGNVVELQVEEHLVAQLGQGADRLGPGGDEQLEADLGHAEPRPQVSGRP